MSNFNGQHASAIVSMMEICEDYNTFRDLRAVLNREVKRIKQERWPNNNQYAWTNDKSFPVEAKKAGARLFQEFRLQGVKREDKISIIRKLREYSGKIIDGKLYGHIGLLVAKNFAEKYFVEYFG